MRHGPDRRSVILGLAATGALPLTGFADTRQEAAFVSCCKMRDGHFAAAVLDVDAKLIFHENLDGRGHDSAISPDGAAAVVFARRPGRFALVLDLVRRQRQLAFSAPKDRHFQGHGFFSNDGRLLFATENDFGGERGVMGIYDVAADYRRVGEIDTGGIGPHEALLLSDGRTVAIANGGILTHPDFPRQKLNLDTMAPSLVYADLTSGDIVETVSLSPELHQLSIRHMAEDGRGRIWFGGQFEGARSETVPLAGWHERGRDIQLCGAADTVWQAMSNYIGSVAASADGRRIAMSSPRGNTVLIWDCASGRALEQRSIRDVCGLAPMSGAFLSSDGSGGLELDGAPLRAFDELSWDNHIAVLNRARRSG
ncbi:MAG: DUF1513 domain-containing protein [Rhodobiaceae bacterium]|nr:DUF1513 domain-containing protein [Rhodobiaceae bacterium]